MHETVAKGQTQASLRRGAAMVAAVLLAVGLFAGQSLITASAAEAGVIQGSAAAGKAKSAACAACHGATGNSVSAQWPSLAGQHPSYIVRELKAFKNGERPNAIMVGFASTLSEQDMYDLAAYFSMQTLTPKGADPKLVDQGRQIYRGGIPKSNVPACIGCHGPTGHGNYLSAYPRIAGQHQEYLMMALKDFAAGTRKSDPNQMMRNIASRLTEGEMRAVTSYVQGLQPRNP